MPYKADVLRYTPSLALGGVRVGLSGNRRRAAAIDMWDGSYLWGLLRATPIRKRATSGMLVLTVSTSDTFKKDRGY
jgi:hypothetical protein